MKRILSLLCLCLSLIGCESDEESDIVAISLSPLEAMIVVGESFSFTATGTFADETTGNVNDRVEWHSSQTDVATIAKGSAEGVGIGQTTISASYGSIESAESAALTVNSATLPLTLRLQNEYSRDIVFEIWGGNGLIFENGQVVGYGDKLHPTGSGPAMIEYLDQNTDGMNDTPASEVILQREDDISMLLLIVGVPFQGQYYYITDQAYSNLSGPIKVILCGNGILKHSSDDGC
ncbi:MAG: Ig-like domain-containing protein [Proteobacteria bacterium]|nr:Ig-like domain-containing protein [Pseudomonadota bacterium]